MANEKVGEISCPFCGGTAEVKQNVKNKFYIWCVDDGIIQPTKQNFQEYIRENASFDGAGSGKAEPEKQEEIPKEETQPTQAKEPKAKAGAIDFNSWMES